MKRERTGELKEALVKVAKALRASAALEKSASREKGVCYVIDLAAFRKGASRG